METGRIITQLRIKANLTQEQLAEKLFVSRELVSKWETGSRLPGYSVIQTLSEIFNVSPDSILDRNDMILNDLSECFDNYNIKNEDKITELTTYSDQTYTYVDSDGIEHTGYFVSSENEVEIKALSAKIYEIKLAYYDMQIDKYYDSFHENGLEIYKSDKEYESSFARFYTFASKDKLINYHCKSDEAFVFYPAGYFK